MLAGHGRSGHARVDVARGGVLLGCARRPSSELLRVESALSHREQAVSESRRRSAPVAREVVAWGLAGLLRWLRQPPRSRWFLGVTTS
ncbi:hypothetical protein GCM10023222_32940 [Saccharopolyspora cebuensis]